MIARNFKKWPEALAAQLVLDLEEVFQLCVYDAPKAIRYAFTMAIRRERAPAKPSDPVRLVTSQPWVSWLERFTGWVKRSVSVLRSRVLA